MKITSRVTASGRIIPVEHASNAHWQSSSTLTRVISDVETNRLEYGYRFDQEFREWRRRNMQRHGELVKEIRRRSLRLAGERPKRALKEAVERFLRSPLVQLDVLHDTWVDREGPFGYLALGERQASFYEHWRSRSSDSDILPWSLDPTTVCPEPFYRRGKQKDDGRWRTFYSFGIARVTRQRLVNAALKAATRDQYRSQAIYKGGMSNVADEIRTMLGGNPRPTHWATLDIQNCFDNIRLDSAHGYLPLAPEVIQQTVAINVKEAIDQRGSEHRRHDYCVRRCAGAFASEPSLALPQGAASSPLVAYSLIEAGLPPLPPDRVMLYGDDLLVLGESQEEVRAQVCRFQTFFERHPAGPLQITLEGEGDLREGFEFLGMEFKQVMRDKTIDAQRSIFVSVRIPPKVRIRFLDNVRLRVERALEDGDPQLLDASRYARGFWGSKPTHDRVELMLEACSLIEELGADPSPIWDIMAAG